MKNLKEVSLIHNADIGYGGGEETHSISTIPGKYGRFREVVALKHVAIRGFAVRMETRGKTE